MNALFAICALSSAITPYSITALNQEGNRILLVSAPSDRDPLLAKQRREVDAWKQGAADRDLIVIEVRGKESVRRYGEEHYATTGDDVTEVRQRFRLAPSRFSLVLIGKDGHVALRSTEPLSGVHLQTAIDAMPMRRAELR